VWTNILHSRDGLQGAIADMSAADAEFYGKLLRDDLRLLARTAKGTYPGVEEPLKAVNARVKDLTKHMPRAIKAENLDAAGTDLRHLDIELERVVAFFPEGVLPNDSAPEFQATGSATSDGGPAAVQSTMYVCPMHPEVTSDKPGECSKCGMDLVKKAH
jgi:hypothetical protein